MTLTIDELKRLQNINLYNGGIVIGMILVLLILVFVGLMKASSITSKYLNFKDQQSKNKHQSTTPNQLLDGRYDNEVYTKRNARGEDASAVDEYNKITSSIYNSIKAYQAYNDKINELYMSKHNKKSPDVIDMSILTAENDNY